jgi:ParB/RepB/Spo0J family partition protein
VKLRAEDEARVSRQMREAAYGRQGLMLKPDEVVANPRNPRKTFDENATNDLAANILEVGQLQPIIVRRVNDRYQIVVGERRWRAVRRANLDQVWAVEKNVSDLDAYRMALAENVHRVDLSHTEKVAALDELGELVQDSGLRAAARALGTSHTWLLARLQMRQDPVIFPALEAGDISFMMADQLRRAPAHARRNLLDRVLHERPDPPTARSWVRRSETTSVGNAQRSLLGSQPPRAIRLIHTTTWSRSCRCWVNLTPASSATPCKNSWIWVNACCLSADR